MISPEEVRCFSEGKEKRCAFQSFFKITTASCHRYYNINWEKKEDFRRKTSCGFPWAVIKCEKRRFAAGKGRNLCMNEKEIAEIRRRFRSEKSNITHIRGCYVNERREIVSEFDQPLATLPQEETEDRKSVV